MLSTSSAFCSYSVWSSQLRGDAHCIYKHVRPFVYVNQLPKGGVPATAQAMLNDDGQVVQVLHGPVPLWGTRRGQDVMLSDVLAFDLRVFDPGAAAICDVEEPERYDAGI